MKKGKSDTTPVVPFRAVALERYNASKQLAPEVDLRSPGVTPYIFILFILLAIAAYLAWSLQIPTTVNAEIIDYEPNSLNIIAVAYVRDIGDLKPNRLLEVKAPGLTSSQTVTIEVETAQPASRKDISRLSALSDPRGLTPVTLSGNLNQSTSFAEHQKVLLQGELSRISEMGLSSVRGWLRSV